MRRRTKIVATVGPASDSAELLGDLIKAGVNVFRLGTAHDPVERVVERLELIRKVAADLDATIGILVDLAGPKVRAGFGDEPVELATGSTVEIRSGDDLSNDKQIFVNIEDIARKVQVGDLLHMGDGTASLIITEVSHGVALAQVSRGGTMRGRPGVHIPSDRLDGGSPTTEDLEYFDAVVAAGVDMVAVSFVKTARDVRALKGEPAPKGPMIIAKIETQAAVDNLDSILEFSDAIMVARGDLGLECGLPVLPGLQKKIIRTCVQAGKPVITATQMLETMTTNSQPTRAEVTDVANAVHDGTSAVMLSGETAVGHDPVLVVETMSTILEEAETNFAYRDWAEQVEAAVVLDSQHNDRDKVAIAMRSAAQRAASALSCRSIVAITGTGTTARAISRYRPAAEIIAVAPSERVLNQLALSWGVRPVLNAAEGEGSGRIYRVLRFLRDLGLLTRGELVPVVAGATNSALVSNVLRLDTVPEDDGDGSTPLYKQ